MQALGGRSPPLSLSLSRSLATQSELMRKVIYTEDSF